MEPSTSGRSTTEAETSPDNGSPRHQHLGGVQQAGRSRRVHQVRAVRPCCQSGEERHDRRGPTLNPLLGVSQLEVTHWGRSPARATRRPHQTVQGAQRTAHRPVATPRRRRRPPQRTDQNRPRRRHPHHLRRSTPWPGNGSKRVRVPPRIPSDGSGLGTRPRGRHGLCASVPG